MFVKKLRGVSQARHLVLIERDGDSIHCSSQKQD